MEAFIITFTIVLGLLLAVPVYRLANGKNMSESFSVFTGMFQKTQSSPTPVRQPRQTPSWLNKMFKSASGLFGTLIVLTLFIWLLFWITGHKNPIAYITGEQTQEVTAPPGNWTKWIEVEKNWKFKLFYDGKIALQVKSKQGVSRTVLCEQRGNDGVPLYIKDAETGKLLPMVIGDKITEIRVKSVEATPITVKIEHWKEEYPVVQQ